VDSTMARCEGGRRWIPPSYPFTAATRCRRRLAPAQRLEGYVGEFRAIFDNLFDLLDGIERRVPAGISFEDPNGGRIYFHNLFPGRRGTGRAAGGIHPRELLSGPDQSHVSGGIGLFLPGQSLAACMSLKDSYRG
jgi:hypothetical protein